MAKKSAIARDEKRKKMRLLMDMIPTLKKPITIRKLKDKVGLDEKDIYGYLSKWGEKGLLKIC